jgi:hypothetical protein
LLSNIKIPYSLIQVIKWSYIIWNERFLISRKSTVLNSISCSFTSISFLTNQIWYNHNRDEMVNMIALSMVDRGFEPWLSQTKYNNIGISCLSVKKTALKCKNHLNVSKCSDMSDMSTHGLLFQWDSTIKIQLSVFVYYKANIIIISLNVTSSCYNIAEKYLIWR